MRISRRRLLRATACTVLLVLAPGASLAAETTPSDSDEPTTLVHADIARAMHSAELSMLFRGETESECRVWQERFRAKLTELLGDSTPPQKWEVEEENRTEFDDHVRYELLLKADVIPRLPVYLLVPKGAACTQKLPAVLCVHGHGPFGNHPVVGRRDLEGVAENIAKSNYDYGLQFVQRGFVVAAPCMIPFGRRVELASVLTEPLVRKSSFILIASKADTRGAAESHFLCSIGS